MCATYLNGPWSKQMVGYCILEMPKWGYRQDSKNLRTIEFTNMKNAPDQSSKGSFASSFYDCYLLCGFVFRGKSPSNPSVIHKMDKGNLTKKERTRLVFNLVPTEWKAKLVRPFSVLLCFGKSRLIFFKNTKLHQRRTLLSKITFHCSERDSDSCTILSVSASNASACCVWATDTYHIHTLWICCRTSLAALQFDSLAATLNRSADPSCCDSSTNFFRLFRLAQTKQTGKKTRNRKHNAAWLVAALHLTSLYRNPQRWRDHRACLIQLTHNWLPYRLIVCASKCGTRTQALWYKNTLLSNKATKQPKLHSSLPLPLPLLLRKRYVNLVLAATSSTQEGCDADWLLFDKLLLSRYCTFACRPHRSETKVELPKVLLKTNSWSH